MISHDNKTLVKVKTFAFIPNDEEEMKKVLYKYGPIAGAVNGIMCMYYDEGIYVRKTISIDLQRQMGFELID